MIDYCGKKILFYNTFIMAYTRIDERRKLKKNAYHTKFIQNLKNVYKFLMNIFVLFASFEAFWSLKNNEQIFDKKLHNIQFLYMKVIR